MKNRIISLVLLVAMVITALPLVAFPVIAAEETEKTFTAEEYDDLYVKNGLIFAMDFFSTNSLWGGSAVTLSSAGTAKQYKPFIRIPESGVNVTGGTGMIKDGYFQQDQSNVNSTYMQIGFGTDTLSAANKQITAEYVQQYDLATGTQFYIRGRWINTTGSAMGENGMTLTFASLWGSIARYNAGNGTWGSHWTTISKIPANSYAIGTRAMPLSFVFDSAGYTTSTTAADGHSLLTIYAPDLDQPIVSLSTLTGGDLMLTDPNKFMNNNGTLGDTKNPSSPPGTYLTTDGTYQSGNGKDYVDAYYGATDQDATSWTDRIGYSNSFAGRIYAIRYYNRALSQAETRQNHFADLAKFFRIDISLYTRLTAEGKAAIHAAAKAYSVDGDRETIATALETAILNTLQAEYSTIYAGQLDAEIIAVGAEYLLDLSLIAGISRGALANTYKLLLGDLSAVSDVAAAYEAAVKADLAAYAAASTLTAADYNALYVKEDLRYALDFFATNSYWGEAGGVFTAANTADYKALIAASEWYRAASDAGLTFNNISGTNSITIQNGYMDSSAFTNFWPQGEQKIAPFNNVSVEYVMQMVKTSATATQVGFMINNQRVFANATTGELQEMHIQTNIFKPLSNYPTYNGNKVTLDSVFAPTTFAYSVSFATNLNAAWATTYWDGNPEIDDGKIRVAEYIEVDGETVISVSSTRVLDKTNDRKFFWPVAPREVEAQYIDGVKQDSASKYFVVFEDERKTPASVTIMENGEVKFATDDAPFLNNDAGYNGAYWNWSTIRNNVYAVRYYEGELTAAENAQNHFADLAKWYRLNISGFSALNDAQKQTVYAAMAEFGFAEDRDTVQGALMAVLSPIAREAYEALKGEDSAMNALIDLAAEYSMDLTDVLAFDGDLSYVYATVTAGALIGKTCAEAQAILDRAMYAAEHYAARYVEGAATAANRWNALIDYAIATQTADAALNIESLVLLPWSLAALVEIDPDADLADTQAYVDAFVAAKMKGFTSGAAADYDYDSLYVQDGLIFAMDFFKTNAYWNTDGTEYIVPQGPSDMTAYEYEGKTYNFKEVATDRLCYRLVKDKKYLTNDEYATQAEAEAALAALEDSTGVTVLEAATAAFRKATDEWAAADKAFLAGFTTYAAAGKDNYSIYAFSYVPAFGPDKNTQYSLASLYVEKTMSVFDMGAGYVTLHNRHHSSGGLQFSNLKYFDTPVSTQQMVITLGKDAKNVFTIFGDLRPNLKSNYDGTAQIDKLNSGSASFVIGTDAGGNSLGNFSGLPISLNNVLDYTMTMIRTDEDNGDRVYATSGNGTLFDVEGNYGKSALDNTCYIGWSFSAVGAKIYAYRNYTTELTAADRAQNHFADLAKFYRLDLTAFDSLSDDVKADLYASFAAYELDAANRDELQAIYNNVILSLYEGVEVIKGDEEANEAFLALAAKGLVDINALLANGEEIAARVAKDLLMEFPFETVSGTVVRAVCEAMTLKCKAVSFAGFQVRLDTGVEAFNYAGLRGVFDVDMEGLKKVASIYRGASVITYVGAQSATGSSSPVVIGLVFTYDEEADAVVIQGIRSGEGDEAIFEDVKTYERVLADGSTVTSMNYTITYRGEDFNVDLLTSEVRMMYATGIVAGSQTAGIPMMGAAESEVLGDLVSAAEVYAYFAGTEEYANDAMVRKVLETASAGLK